MACSAAQMFNFPERSNPCGHDGVTAKSGGYCYNYPRTVGMDKGRENVTPIDIMTFHCVYL